MDPKEATRRAREYFNARANASIDMYIAASPEEQAAADVEMKFLVRSFTDRVETEARRMVSAAQAFSHESMLSFIGSRSKS